MPAMMCAYSQRESLGSRLEDGLEFGQFAGAPGMRNG
jgi:hypothetical protein